MLYVVIIVCAAVLVAADQIIKYVVDTNLEIGESVVAIEGVLDWHHLRNEGASFSILEGQRWFFIIGTFIILGIIAFILARKMIIHWVGYLSATLIIAGGIGNLIDRIRFGEVIDYIDISPLFDFAVFNFADCCIVVGGILMCVYILFIHDKVAIRLSENDPAIEESSEEDE